MTPSVVALESDIQDQYDETRPIKRLKSKDFESADPNDNDVHSAIPQHPLGVKPAGNVYTATHNLKDAAGSFRWLPDEIVVQLLEHLDATSLIHLGSTCKALYAFTRLEELWKTLFLESPPKDLHWRGSWRSTYLCLPQAHISSIPCRELYSDVLYRPFQCARLPLDPYARDIPSPNRIPRLSNLSEDEYKSSWSDKPFILTEPVKQWPVYSGSRAWTIESLLNQYGDVKFRAECVDWPLKAYVEYMRDSANEESPLYLFDRSFTEKMNIKVGSSTDFEDAAYWPPTCFGADLFTVLGPQRPDSRWLIIGPAGGGSTFHKDPNGTSAWNAPLTGSKYWLMFPPSSSSPPGVFLSDDSSEITSPLSIAEYLLTFHEEARQAPGCREGVCNAGEVLHVPAGWFHLVLNLEESIALTQNFVPGGKVGEVLHFLRDKSDQVSGFKDDVKDPYGLWVERLREHKPEVLEDGIKEMERLANKRGRWEEIVKGGEEEEGGFSFGFGGEDDEEEEAEA